jgi:signal transduction histidine kinase
MLRLSLAALCLFQAAPIAFASDPPLLEQAARLLSSEFRRADERLALVRKSQPLAQPHAAHCPALGYHSRAAYAPTQTRWVQVDLGEPQVVDQVLLIPAIGPPGNDGPGYYFPLQFRIDVANRPDFSDNFTAAEHVTDPDSYGRPVVIPVDGRKVRFIRVTATRLAGKDGLYFFALGELLALSGNRNLAAERPVTAFDSIENPPVWGTRYLVDGQSMIGPPLSPFHNPSNGYHSEVSSTADAVKWVQVDLGSTQTLDEVRMIPARPIDFADRSGFGFPVRFRVEASEAADFNSSKLLLDATRVDYANPGDGLVVIPTPSVSARYIRVTATKLWERTGDFVFALAELQAYSHGLNVALGSRVSALDSIERGHWSREYLVDGVASQYGLYEWPEWVTFQQRWAHWQSAQREAVASWEAARADALRSFALWALGLLCAVVVAATGLLWRARVVRRREADRVREQISRDLHDEVGSNLGGIMLLAQSGDGCDLPEISRIAGETAAAMRDLVWLIDGCRETLSDLSLKLRETAAVQLVGLDYDLDLRDFDSSDRIEAKFKRHFFLSFKEILHNVARHAAAHHVDIRAFRDGGWMILEVQDDGHGFDPQSAAAGSGLRSIRDRAEMLSGELEIHSTAECGTLVRLIVWLGLEKPKPRLLPGLSRCARVLGWSAA